MISTAEYIFSHLEAIVLSIFTLAFFVQVFYYVYFYSRIFFLNETNETNLLPPVSVIICARNEEQNIKNFLPQVLAQDYPNFQVVVVEDCSDDETAKTLTLLQGQHKNLYVTRIHADPIFRHSKKLALSIGIKAAKHEVLIFTDADCYPTSQLWLRKMVNEFDPDTDFVLGYGAYQKQKGLLNYLIRYDTATIGLQYLSFALASQPYMGVGRNMAYRKKVFVESNGYGYLNQLPSGDDDLLVNKYATPTNTKVLLDNAAFTCSLPETSWANWRKQKQRHRTTYKHYKFLHRLLLALEPLSRVIFYGCFLGALFFFPTFVYYLLGLFLLRTLVLLATTLKGFSMLNEKHLGWGILFLDVCMPIVYLWLARQKKSKTRKQSTWM